MGPTCPRPSQGNLWDRPGIPSEKLPNLPSGPNLTFSLEIPYPSLYGNEGMFCSPEIGRVGSGRVGSGRNVSPGAGATLPSPIVPSAAASHGSGSDGEERRRREARDEEDTARERARDRGFHSLCETRRRKFQ
jgi:hypothetical protein